MYPAVKIAAGVLILFFSSWAEMTVLYRLTIIGIKPLLLLPCVVFIAMWEKEIAGLVFGILAGCLADFSSGGPPGLNAVSFGLAGYLVGHFWMKFARESLFTQIVLAFLSSFFYLLLYYFLASFSHPLPPLKESFLRIILPVSIYTTIIAPFVFAILSKGYHTIEKIKFLTESNLNNNIQTTGGRTDENEDFKFVD